VNERNDQKCPIKELCTSDTTELCHWLCMFVKEARRDDGQPYTPHSLTQLLSGIQHFISKNIYHSWVSTYTTYTTWGGVYADSRVAYAIYTHLFFYVM